MRSFAFPCLLLKNTAWLWTRNTSSMFSVGWIEVTPLRTAFALCRGSCGAVVNNLEVSFQAFRDFIYTAVVREKKFVIISYKCNGHFQTVFVWRWMGRGWRRGWGRREREREREGCFWDAFYAVCFIGQFVAKPETGLLLCRTHDCDGIWFMILVIFLEGQYSPIIFVRDVDFETAFNYEPTSAPTIDLLSLYVLFSQCGSCDNNLEDYFIHWFVKGQRGNSPEAFKT